MESYTYKCPGCGAALTFDPEANMLLCDSCGAIYYPSEVSSPEETKAPSGADSIFPSGDTTEQSTLPSSPEYSNAVSPDPDYMEVNIYHCSSCGAELMTNDLEVSRFCSFCGQPTILFDRVSKERKPEKIIPFSISKEKALLYAKTRFADGKFLCDDIQNLTVESVYGIYMPYWKYSCEMDLALDVTVKSNDTTRQVQKGDHVSREVLLDASDRFHDDVSLQLNPFNLQAAVDFTPAYLSGFYADRNDVDSDSRAKGACEYLEDLLTEQILETIPGVPSKTMRDRYKQLYDASNALRIKVLQRNFQVHKETYLFCPVYFITFHIGQKTVIILVNGSSGKVVGSIPIDEKKFKARQIRDMIFFSILFGAIGAFIFAFFPIIWSALFLGILGISIFLNGKNAKSKYEEMYAKTNSETMFDISKNRE